MGAGDGSGVSLDPPVLPVRGGRRIYVASSWRNGHQPGVVDVLRDAGHRVYDFRNPAPGNTGFSWSEIDPDWQRWSTADFRDALRHPIALSGFGFDLRGMEGADTCVLVLPSGRSAHLEAGWFAGRGLPLVVYSPEPCEPELMYLLGGGHVVSRLPALLAAVGAL